MALFDDYLKTNPGWKPSAPTKTPKTLFDQMGPTNQVSISLDPTTRQINIKAPQYYIDSKEFKDQVLPQFKQLEGKQLTDTDFKQIVNSDMVKDLQQQADDVAVRHQAVQAYKKQFPKASEDDAMIFLRNVAAAQQSNKDENTQIVIGRNDDGTLKTKSVKDFLGQFKDMSDELKGRKLTGSLKQAEDPNTSEADRAIQLSIVKFLQDKGTLNASLGTKINRASLGALQSIGDSIVGKIASIPSAAISAAMGNGYKDLEANTKAQLEQDPAGSLEGANQVAQFAAPAASILATGADIAATAGAGEFGALKLANTISRTEQGARAVQGARAGLNALEETGLPGRIAANEVRQLPQNLTYGAAKTLTDGDYNAPQDFAINAAINAATLGVGRAGLSALRSIDTASNGTLLRASEAVGRTTARGVEAVEKIPGIGKAMKAFSTNFLDQASPLRRAARNAWARGDIETIGTADKPGYIDVSNAIRSAIQRGRGEARNFMEEAPEFSQAFQASDALAQMGDDQLRQANQYVNARQQLQYAETGRYQISKKKQEELSAIVSEHKNDENDAYYQAIADWNARITDFGVANGVYDEDLIRIMREDPSFASGYVRLQKSLPGIEDNVNVKPSAQRNLKNREATKKLKGPAALEDLEDPFVVANQHLNALSEIAATNRVNRIAVSAINEGWVNGRILQSPEDLRTRATLRNSFKEERDIVNELVGTQVTKLEGDLNKLVDDVEDFNGSGRVTVAKRIQDSIDDMVDQIIKDPKLNPEVQRLMDELGGGKEGAERVAALGVLNRNKKQITDRLETSLRNTELGREERASVVRDFDSQINDELDLELAQRGTGRSPLTSQFDELKRLNKELSPAVDKSNPGVQAYYDRGTKGYYELADPDMQNYFNMRKDLSEDNWFQRLMMNTSRIFKLTTTGINPTFLPVNLMRDFPQGAVTAGMNVLAPRTTHRALLESLGVADDEIDRLDREFTAFIGNSTQFDISREAERALESSYQIGKELERGPLKSVTVNLVDARHPGQQLRQVEDLFGKVETFTRERIYKARFESAISRGLGVEQAQQEALFYAANATTDFLNVGARVQSLVRTIPYLTAAINGKASFMRVWMLDPIGVTARLGAGIVTPMMWLAIHNLTDDERAAGYFKVPQFDRQNNLIVMLDDKNYIKIPLGQELAGLAAPFRERIEAHYGLEKNNFMQTMTKFVLSQSPVDLSPLAERNYAGNVDLGRAGSQIASTAVPQIFRQPIEMMTGRDLYTGAPINPTDQDLYDSGQVAPGEPITDADRTFAGRDSRTLGVLANIVNLPQGTLQAAVKNYGGAVGQMMLNSLDKLVGAPAEKQGGKALDEALAGRFFGGSFDQMQNDFYAGVDRLDREKQILQEQLTRLNQSTYGGGDPAAVTEQRQQLIDKFGEQVATFANTYGDFYQRAGGIRPFQLDAIVRLLNLAPDQQGTFDPGTYQNDAVSQVAQEAKSDAVRRATDLGLDTSNDRDRYGRLLVDDNGNPYEDITRSSWANSNITQRVYGAPKQLAYEFSKIVKADRKAGTPSLYDAEQKYYDQLDKLYTQAKGLKGTAAQAIYKQISDLQEEYMAKEFDPRIKPLLDKYGPEALMGNKDIFNEIGSRIMVPGDYTPFTSRKKQPYQQDDVEAFLLDRYGVGRLNATNLPTDKEAEDMITQINTDLSSGRSAAASYKLQRLQNNIGAGNTYVDQDAMNRIKSLITIANGR